MPLCADCCQERIEPTANYDEPLLHKGQTCNRCGKHRGVPSLVGFLKTDEKYLTGKTLLDYTNGTN